MTTHLSWKPAFHVAPAGAQPDAAWDRIAGAGDVKALRTLADFTDPLARDAAGLIALFPPARRPAGPLPPAFAYPPLAGARFADGFHGVLVAARERTTAIAEAACFSAAFLRATHAAPLALPMRLALVEIEGDFADAEPACAPAADGVLFRGARPPHGACVAVFNPARVRFRGEAVRLLFEWDGGKIAEVYEKIVLP